MEKKITKRAVRSALRSLGNTPKQIAASLVKLGIRTTEGVNANNWSCKCPLVVFLKSIFGDVFIRVLGTDIFIGGPDVSLSFRPSKMIARFVLAVDQLKYPNLLPVVA